MRSREDINPITCAGEAAAAPTPPRWGVSVQRTDRPSGPGLRARGRGAAGGEAERSRDEKWGSVPPPTPALWLPERPPARGTPTHLS